MGLQVLKLLTFFKWYGRIMVCWLRGINMINLQPRHVWSKEVNLTHYFLVLKQRRIRAFVLLMLFQTQITPIMSLLLWAFSFPCVFIKSIKCQGEWPKDSGYSIYGIDHRAKVLFLSNISTENTFVFSSPCFLLRREIINERSEHQDRQQKASKQTGEGSFYPFLHDFSLVFRI